MFEGLAVVGPTNTLSVAIEIMQVFDSVRDVSELTMAVSERNVNREYLLVVFKILLAGHWIIELLISLELTRPWLFKWETRNVAMLLTRVDY